MNSSQLIYTSWKNGESPNKGFMVYSKSTDITDSEEKEILSLMRYKPLSTLPYAPTDDEIEKTFPRNLSYVKLSSGRYCLAQSSYVGQDYSTRWGNYIIHAYVFKSNEGLIPMNFYNSDIFRRRLNSNELNAPNAPSSLPIVNVSNVKSSMTPKEIASFFTMDKRKMLKVFVQAILNNKKNKLGVFVNEDYQNVKYWISILPFILPQKYFTNLSFSTYIMEVNSLLDISFMQPGGYTINFPVEVKMNKYYVIDMKYNQYSPNIEVKHFANRVVDLFFEDMYKCVEFVNKAFQTMDKYRVSDLDLVYYLLKTENNDLTIFKDIDSFNMVYDILSKNSNFDLNLLSNNILNLIENDKNSIFRNKEIYKRIFDKLSQKGKEELIKINFVDYYSRLDPNLYEKNYQDMKTEFIFPWNSVINWFVNDEAFVKNNYQSNDMNLRYFIIMNIIYTNKVEYNKYLTYILCQLIKEKKNDLFMNILKIVSNKDKALEKKMITEVLLQAKDLVDNNLVFLFDLLCSNINDEFTFINTFKVFICLKDYVMDKVIDLFITTNKYDNILRILRKYRSNDKQIEAFLIRIDIRKYQNNTEKNISTLIEIYRNYIDVDYVDPLMKQLFLQKINAFINNNDDNKDRKAALSVYDSLFKGKDIKENKEYITILMNKFINKITIKDIKNQIEFSRRIKEIRNIFDVLQISIPKEINLYSEGESIKASSNMLNKDFQKGIIAAAENKQIYYLQYSTSQFDLSEFIDVYFDAIFSLIVNISKSSISRLKLGDIKQEEIDCSFSKLMRLFIEPLSKYEAFDDKMYSYIKTNDYEMDNVLLIRLLNFVFDENTIFSNKINDILNRHIKKMGKNKAASRIEQIKDKIDNKEEYAKYLKALTDKKPNIFKRIFGKLFGKREKKENGEK